MDDFFLKNLDPGIRNTVWINFQIQNKKHVSEMYQSNVGIHTNQTYALGNSTCIAIVRKN